MSSSTSSSSSLREWSPIPLLEYDHHYTLPLTTRLLAVLKSDYIHPVLPLIFGTSICGRGDYSPNDEYVTEVRDIAAQFPHIDIFKDDELLICKFTKRIEDRRLCSVAFVLALTPISGRSGSTSEVNRRIVAMRDELKSMKSNVLKESILEVILVLIKWEWSDRCAMALSMLNAGFQFTVPQSRMMWILMSLDDQSYKREVITKLKTERGLWYSIQEMEYNCIAATVDLAIFVLMIKQISIPDTVEDKPWFIKARTKFQLSKEDWTASDVIQFILAQMSIFGIKAVVGYFLTIQQRMIFLEKQSSMILTPDEFLHDIILSVI